MRGGKLEADTKSPCVPLKQGTARNKADTQDAYAWRYSLAKIAPRYSSHRVG